MSAFSFTVPTTSSRPCTKRSGFSFTVPTTCSRPSTKMSAFMVGRYVSFSVAGALAGPFESKS